MSRGDTWKLILTHRNVLDGAIPAASGEHGVAYVGELVAVPQSYAASVAAHDWGPGARCVDNISWITTA